MIEFIEDGMELSQVREILNAIIRQINENKTVPISYNDLNDRPCINEVELTSKTKAQELKLTLSQFENIKEIENLVIQIGEQKIAEMVQEANARKLDSDFSVLQPLQYNLDEGMSVAINTGKGEICKTTLGDLIMYLKHEIIKIDSQYLRVIH